MIAVSTFDHYRFIPQIRPEDPALTKGRVNGRSSNHGGIFFVGGWGRHGKGVGLLRCVKNSSAKKMTSLGTTKTQKSPK
jgi:hypothetical protein